MDQVQERAGDTLRARALKPVGAGDGPRELMLNASIPNPFGGKPLAQLSVHLTSEQHAEGESFRLRAHVQTQLVMPPPGREALAGPANGDDGGTGRALLPRSARAARDLVQRGLQSQLAGAVTPFLERRFETWLDLRASTRPLDQGARALVPERVQELGLGHTPLLRTDTEPHVESWAGRCEGERPGVAQVTLLQFNEGAPRGGKRKRKPRRPIHVAASVATFYEDERRGK
jgi:hypothetical protein